MRRPTTTNSLFTTLGVIATVGSIIFILAIAAGVH
jgi:hypothetical protein